MPSLLLESSAHALLWHIHYVQSKAPTLSERCVEFWQIHPVGLPSPQSNTGNFPSPPQKIWNNSINCVPSLRSITSHILAIKDLLSVTRDLPFLEFHLHGIMWMYLFGSGCFHSGWCCWDSSLLLVHTFLTRQYCIDHNLLIQSSFDGHVCCF